MLHLRPYQEETLDALRKGFAQGKRAQILYAPTGAGKTEMAIALLHAAKTKGSRAAMVLDRIILCDQTSQRLDRYNIDHGVLQSKHRRYRPSEPIQVCSAQTLEARGSFPGLNLLIVDECHVARKQTKDFIKNNQNIKVVGLTATPFTKGLSDIYQNVVSITTTKELVNQSILVPLRVFVSTEIDMEGAKKVAGEWSTDEIEKRGMKITGDIVQEWIAKTHEIYNKPEKTIVFCAGVAHGTDISRKFAEHGYNFVSISYLDDDQFKRDIIKDFSRPDTTIHGLIATDILTKGFDVPDVRIGVSARPFAKSLSSHIQQMGRVMRGCDGKCDALWLDHSGNYLRFRDQWDEVFNDGVLALSDEKEKPRKEIDKVAKEKSKCPKCNALWPPNSDVCSHCGHVRERKNKVEAEPGRLVEIGASNTANKQDWWSQLWYKVEFAGWREGRAAHTFKEKFGVWPRNLRNVSKPPTAEVEKFIRHRLMVYLRGRK